MAAVAISCPSCKAALKLPGAAAGKVRCPRCGSVFAPSQDAPTSGEQTLAVAPVPRETESDLVRPKGASEDTFTTVAPHSEEQAELEGLLAPAQGPGELGRLRPYRVLKILGQGGMGVVFLAEDPALQRKVALKAMLPRIARNASAKDRFLREARAAARLKHEHIVAIHQVGVDRGIPFLAIEFLEGESLDDRLKREDKLPIPEVVRIGRQIAEGLAAAHEQHLIHRDIKPANIWLEKRKSGKAPTVKILDFGLAKEKDDTAHLTQTGIIVGTPAYMPPEQAGSGEIDARADLYSLGVVLYRMATGDLPIKGKDTLRLLSSLALDTPRPPIALNPDVPADLNALIVKLLAKNAADRVHTAEEVAAALEAMVPAPSGATLPGGPAASLPDASKSEERTASLPTPSATSSTSASPEATPAPREAPRKKRPLAKLALLFLGAAVLVVAAAFGLIRIATPDGDFVIDTDDPDFAFSVSKDKVLLDDKKTKRQYQLKVLKQKGGDFELEVTDAGNDLAFHTKTFTIKRGQTVALKAWFERKQVAEVKTPPKVEPKKEPPIAGTAWKPIPVGEGPLDKLDPAAIPKEERHDEQPKELVAVIGTQARRHWSMIHSVAISPDGKLAATGTDGGNDRDHLIIWDMATQTPKWRMRWKGSWLSEFRTIHFTQDSRRLIVGSRGNGSGTQMIDLSGPTPKWLPFTVEGKATTAWYHQLGAWTVVLEMDRTLAIGGQGSVSLFDRNGDSPQLVTDKFPVGPGVFATQVDQMFYTSPEGKLRRATVKGAKFVEDVELPIPLEPKEYPRAVRDDGKVLALGKKDRLELWDIAAEKPKRLHQIKESNETFAIVLSPDGRWLTASYNLTGLWRIDGAEPKFVALLDETGGGPSQVAFSRDGNRAIVGNTKGFVRFWDLSGAEPKELSPFDPATAFQHSGWDKSLTLDGARGTIMLHRFDPQPGKRHRNQTWNLGAGKPSPVTLFDTGIRGPLRALGKDRWLQIGLDYDRSQLYHSTPEGIKPQGEPFGDPGTLGNVSPDGKTLVVYKVTPVGKQTELKGWDVSTDSPKLLWSLKPKNHTNLGGAGGYQVWFSPDNRWFATRGLPAKEGEPWKLVVWRNTGGNPEVHAIVPCPVEASLFSAAFSPDGRYLAHTPETFSFVCIMDLTGPMPREVRKFQGHGEIYSLAFHPDGKHLAYGGNRGAWVLDVTTGKTVYEWEAPGQVHWLDWAADGRHLVTHNGNQTLYVLRLNDLAAK